MKLRILCAVLVVAAMGPAREAPLPVTPPTAPAVAQPITGADVVTPGDVPVLPIVPVTRQATEVAPGDFLWAARPVVVFADTPNDPAFLQQVEALAARPEMLAARDVVVIVDSDPAADSVWRQAYHPRGFSLVIIDKDGQVKLRKPFPWDVREISRSIDKFPLRRQEIGRAGLQP